MELLTYFNWVLEHQGQIADAVAYIIAGASILVQLTPSDTDNVWVEKATNFLKLISLNKK